LAQSASRLLAYGPKMKESLSYPVNGIAGIGAKHFKIEKQDKATDRIAFANERRVHLFDNLDAVARFDHQVMVKNH
jgi:hypothetical protein